MNGLSQGIDELVAIYNGFVATLRAEQWEPTLSHAEELGAHPRGSIPPVDWYRIDLNEMQAAGHTLAGQLCRQILNDARLETAIQTEDPL